MRMSALMLLHLACTASAAHSDILDRSSESGCLMAFKMCQRNKYIRIHNCASYISFFAVFTVRNRHDDVISSAKTVSDNDLTTCSNRIKAVNICAVHMFKRILAASRIQSVAIGKKRQPALLFDNIGNSLGIIGPKVCKVSEFTEMHLDRHELTVHID